MPSGPPTDVQYKVPSGHPTDVEFKVTSGPPDYVWYKQKQIRWHTGPLTDIQY